MVEIIANPAKFDRRQVEIVGFLYMNPEVDMIFFHKDDYEHLISGNSIYLRIPRTMRSGIQMLNLKYVRIRGTVGRSAGKRHNLLCIEDIKLIELHSKPDRPIALFMSDYTRTVTEEEAERIKQGISPEDAIKGFK